MDVEESQCCDLGATENVNYGQQVMLLRDLYARARGRSQT